MRAFADLQAQAIRDAARIGVETSRLLEEGWRANLHAAVEMGRCRSAAQALETLAGHAETCFRLQAEAATHVSRTLAGTRPPASGERSGISGVEKPARRG